MTAKSLPLGPGFDVPIDVVVEQTAILAKKGAGKSNAAVVEAEQLWDAGVAWVAVDPKGDWWGIRSSADGKGPGLPVPVFGGKHGDIPLEPTAGGIVAELILGDEGRGYLSCVLDVSQFTLADQRRFLKDFGERLFARKDEEGVLHLFLEEAHEYLPQSVGREQTQLVHVWQRIGKQGRFKGLGLTVISQRTAALNKDVLNQSDNLIVLRTMGPRDINSIGEWLRYHVGADDLLSTLANLKPGEAWIWSPEHIAEAKRFRFRQRRTYDSGATPKVGQTRRPPATIADVDLGAIKDAMAATIERAKADDPAELRKRIRDLERQLKERPAAEPEVRVETVTVEIPVLDDDLAAELRSQFAAIRQVLDEKHGALVEALDRFANLPPAGVPAAATPATPRTASGNRARPAEAPTVRERPASPRASTVAQPAGGDVRLGKGERTVLEVLAEYPDGRTYNELAFLAGYSAKASTLGVILSNLRKGGLVDPGNNPVRPTADGLAAVGGARERPSGQALLHQWLRHPRMGEGERRVLLALIDAYPDAPGHEELCETTGYSPSASTIGVVLSKLRKLGLVEKGARRVAPEFMEAIA